MTHLTYNQSKLTNDIDKLVKQVLFNNLSHRIFQDQLNSLYRPFMFIYYLDNCLKYSHAINTFVKCTNEIIGFTYPCDVIWDYDKTERLIELLSGFKDYIMRELYDWRYQESQNRKNLDNHFKSLIENRSRVLVIFIELKYLKHQRHNVSIYDFHNHMKHFLKTVNKRNACFKGLTGYIWALEQGYKNGGFHCHLVLTYNNSERYSDWHIAKTVGDKWQEITGGVGTYHSSHDTKSKQYFKKDGKLGIGRIQRNDPEQVENAFNVARYLTKQDKYAQKLKVWIPRMHTFGQGEFDKN